jgi:hypothetical protein
MFLRMLEYSARPKPPGCARGNRAELRLSESVKEVAEWS